MKTEISIVIPAHNEESNIPELARRIREVMDPLNRNYEAIFVNDGSTDKSWEVLQKISKEYPQIKGIDLAGNYGQTIGLRAGIEAAEGEIIVAMDGDLQHDPAYIPEFLKYMDEGYDMVGGSKANRPEGFIKKGLANFAHWIIRQLSGVRMKYFGATFRVYRSYLLKNTNMLGDAHRFLGAIIARKGIKYKEVPIEIKERNSGKTNYKLKKIFLVIIDLIFLRFIISYLNKPFRLFGTWGGLIFTIGLLGTLFFVAGSIFLDFHIRQDFMAEFLFAIALMLIGLFLVSIGIIAEIGIYNYFSRTNNSPYNTRRKTTTHE